ncbi:MAG: phosphopyruvate hydratase [Candidatus Babeliales bacterium]
MGIKTVHGRTIFNSRGQETIECIVTLDSGKQGVASVPSGLSVSSHEACQMPASVSCTQALQLLKTKISPLLVGKQADVVTVDALLLHLDDTEHKEKLGAQLMLAISMAVARAQALESDIDLYELIAYLCSFDTVILPLPFFNFISGGMHARNGLSIQEFLVVPCGAKNFRQAMEITHDLHQKAKKMLTKKKLSTATSDEGAFADAFHDDKKALDFLVELLESCEFGSLFKLAIDVAATRLYDPKRKLYVWGKQELQAHEMIDFYSHLISTYPICSIEDGLHENDWVGWQKMTERLGQFVQITGDDFLATNPQRIYEAGERSAANGVIIKPNQIGTVTETLQAVQVCKEYGLGTMVSHRSGETNDTFIADLAVGSSAGQIKAGGFSHGERMAKYNRLLEIEENLTLLALEER